MKLSNMYGKKIFALYEGEIIGTIADSIFNSDYNKIYAFKIFDNEENEFELRLCDIKCFSDCVVITNKNKLNSYVDTCKKSLFFKDVISEFAEFLGKIVDAEIDETGNVINFFTESNVVLNPKNIYVRKDFIFYSESKISISNYRPKKARTNILENIQVKILNFESTAKNYNIFPSKIKFNTDTILGKIAKQNLIGLNNEVIIKANQIITERTIEDATRHNRLNQLYFISN